MWARTINNTPKLFKNIFFGGDAGNPVHATVTVWIYWPYFDWKLTVILKVPPWWTTMQGEDFLINISFKVLMFQLFYTIMFYPNTSWVKFLNREFNRTALHMICSLSSTIPRLICRSRLSSTMMIRGILIEGAVDLLIRRRPIQKPTTLTTWRY